MFSSKLINTTWKIIRDKSLPRAKSFTFPHRRISRKTSVIKRCPHVINFLHPRYISHGMIYFYRNLVFREIYKRLPRTYFKISARFTGGGITAPYLPRYRVADVDLSRSRNGVKGEMMNVSSHFGQFRHQSRWRMLYLNLDGGGSVWVMAFSMGKDFPRRGRESFQQLF